MKFGLVQTDFKRFDPRSYLQKIGGNTFVCRTRLNRTDWSVKNWLCLKVHQLPYNQTSVRILSKQIIRDLDDGTLVGKCYPAVQCIFYLLDTDRLVSHRGKDELGNYHWWLVDTVTNKVIDPTVRQYEELKIDPPYGVGKKCIWHGFRPFPQKRSMDLIHRLQPQSKFYEVTDLSELEHQ